MPQTPIEVSEISVQQIVQDIETKGYGCISGFVGPDELQTMRSFVNAALKGSKGEYVGFEGPNEIVGSTLDTLGSRRDFRQLMESIYEQGTGRRPPDTPFYQVLRCLSGKSAKKHSLNFHYDSYVVTALIPIEIPTSGLSGDLVILPNTRKIRPSYLFNAIDKILLDNRLTQIALRTMMRWRKLPLVRLRPVPGNIYFFWGYRSIHTNEACDPDKVRATALFHYANPHAGSRLKRA